MELAELKDHFKKAQLLPYSWGRDGIAPKGKKM